MAFADRLKEARLKKGYTQEQIALKVGVAKSTYTGYEKGSREPNVNTIGKLMEELNVDANFLWQDETTFPFELTYDEMENLVKKYRALDDHGKEMVDYVLNSEYERSRCVEGQLSLLPIDGYIQIFRNGHWENYKKFEEIYPDYNLDAAHSIPGSSEKDKTHDEDIMDDENF